jgi:ATP-binding cassette, subfamily C (CFTR/MRP), member 4
MEKCWALIWGSLYLEWFINKWLRFRKKVVSGDTSNKIITIVTSELPSIEDDIVLAPYIIISPLSTIIAFTLIAINFREAAIFGFIMYIILVIGQGISSKLTVKWKYLEGLFSDKRISLISEWINGIRTIKSYCWEEPYKNLINKSRRNQLRFLVKNHFINSLGSGIFLNGGLCVAFVVFGYHYLMEREFVYSRTLSAFTMMNYLSLTSIYFSFSAISTFSTFWAIMFRVGEILEKDEFDEDLAEDDRSLPQGIRVKLENWTVSWGQSPKDEKYEESKLLTSHQDEDDGIVLSNLNIEIKSNEFIAVVGSVGSGKTSLLMGIMHELEITKGVVRTNGTMAYVEQDPFIMTGSVKDNIIMGQIFNQERFDKVVEVWCLETDLKILANGENTLIGERGATLSGGQRARISLARAVYSDADIYLLDDPLSAVDPEVGK